MKNLKNLILGLVTLLILVGGGLVTYALGLGVYVKSIVAPTAKEHPQFIEGMAKIVLPYLEPALGLGVLAFILVVVHEKIDTRAWKISKV